MGLILLSLINLCAAEDTLTSLAADSGLRLSPKLRAYIIEVSNAHQVEPEYLLAVAILESSLGTNIKTTTNKNGTQDHGIFQINDINRAFCKNLDLQDIKQNTQCAAKIIARLKPKNLKDLAKYHSKTIKHKEKYYLKLTKVFEKQADKFIVGSNN